MKQDRIDYYASLPVPRYTSYPTAVDFSKTVAPDSYKKWIENLDISKPISLYLHVPFCQKICYYCGCHTKASLNGDTVNHYVDLLIEELKHYKKSFPGKPLVQHIHWGGGTPTIIGKKGFQAIWKELKRIFAFSNGLEHAIELDPRVLDADLIDAFQEIGITRVSFGIQDINPKVQAAIGRIQSLELVEKAVEQIYAIGIKNINFDLVYGLPYQTTETLTHTCTVLKQFEPSRFACFGYAHLPKRRANQRLIKTQSLPSGLERFQQALCIEENLKSGGYIPVGIDHFALPEDDLVQAAYKKRLHRNFQGYTNDFCSTLLGIGSSSISQLENGYAQNMVDLRSYERAILDGNFPILRGHILNDRDRLHSKIIEDLMCYFCVDLKKYGGKSNFKDILKKLDALIEDKLVFIKDECLYVTALGRPFVRVVAVVFDLFRHDMHIGFSPAI